MRRNSFRFGILWRLLIALVLALCLVLLNSNSAAALNLGDHFSFSYSVEFSEAQVEGSEVFYATVEAAVDCTKDLPFPYSLASEAEITGDIIAIHQTTGTRVTLVSGYSLTIKPFPKNEGATTEVHKVESLQFPSGSESGTYTMMAELIQARVKAILIWRDVTDYLPSSKTAGSVTYVPDSGDGGDGGGGGGGGGDEEAEEVGVPAPPEPSLPPGTTDVSDFVSADGTFTETIVVESLDDKCELTIDGGTIGLSPEGERLTQIAMTEMADRPAPPKNYDITGLTYDLGPDGATFEPPITLVITYDESLIPEDVAEENLVIAMWDETTGEWVMLTDGTVDPETNTITAPVSHFTAFAVMVYTGRAIFVTGALSITPAEVSTGEEVTIGTLISNTGDRAGNHKVTLKIDNVVAATREVTLESGASEEVTFTIAKDAAGTYEVTVDGLSGTFVVKGPVIFVVSELSIVPAEVNVGEEVAISTLVTSTGDVAGSYKVTLRIDNVVVATREVTLEGGASEEVTFTMAEDAAGTYAVTVDGLSATFVVRIPPEPVAEPINWWLTGGIIAASVALVVVISLTVIRRRRRA